MTEYTIKQRINNCSVPPTTYSAFKGHTGIAIAQKGKKYGLVTDNKTELWPFEYDNITLAGFSLYILIKNGKLGLLHAQYFNEDSKEPLKIYGHIPCEYDFITLPDSGESFVLLRKDNEKSSLTQIYFTHIKTLSNPIWRVLYQDRDYIITVEDDQRTERIISRTGKTLYTTSGSSTMPLLCETYETFEGTVFVETRDHASASVILLEKRRLPESDPLSDEDYCCYELTGNVKKYTFDKFISPILSHRHFRTVERAFAVGFIFQNMYDYQVLNGNCEPIAINVFDDLKISTSVSTHLNDNTYWETQLSTLVY